MISVWDPAVRLFHWSLVGAMAYEFIAEAGTDLHMSLGYILLGLVGFRLVWGFMGTEHARFKDFVRGPFTIAAYLRDIMRGSPALFVGHNPAGGAMVLMLLGMVGLTAGSGWLMDTDAFWGVAWIENVHRTAAYATLVFIGLHVLGVIAASLQHRENLVRAMITGKKSLPPDHD